MVKMKPQDSLRQSADVFEERGKVYGDAYKNFGHVMKALFPNSVGVHTVEGFNRLGVFTQMVMKIVRYANQFEAGGHDDSLLDLPTYAAMLRELDAEGRMRSEPSESFDPDRDPPRARLPEYRPRSHPSTSWAAEVEIEPIVPRRTEEKSWQEKIVKG
jgi:hypothetical protein